MNYHIAVDGSVYPNPGENAAVAGVVKREIDGDFEEVDRFSRVMADTTTYNNHVVEGFAILEAIRWGSRNLGLYDSLTVYSDDNVVVQHFNKRSPRMKIVSKLLNTVKSCQFTFKLLWIPRERNCADEVVRKVMNNLKHKKKAGSAF